MQVAHKEGENSQYLTVKDNCLLNWPFGCRPECFAHCVACVEGGCWGFSLRWW